MFPLLSSFRCLVVLALTFFTITPARADFASALRQAQKSDWPAACAQWQREVDRHDPRTLYALGLAAELGLCDSDGAPGNSQAAIGHYRQAAEAGFVMAQYRAGVLLLDTQPEEAARWLKQASDKNYLPAHALLGRLYLDGRGVAQDSAEAMRLIQLAAEAQDPEAQFQLSQAYQQGNGVPQDLQHSLEWLKKAARNGHEKAQEMLVLQGISARNR